MQQPARHAAQAPCLYAADGALVRRLRRRHAPQDSEARDERRAAGAARSAAAAGPGEQPLALT